MRRVRLRSLDADPGAGGWTAPADAEVFRSPDPPSAVVPPPCARRG
ncbi:hypothetical protein [Nonomuraea antimicrobica]